MSNFKKNSKVEWKWLGRAVKGSIEQVFTESVTLTIKGKKITRHGTAEKPAYLVRSEAGNSALKLHSELLASKTSVKKTKAKSKPKMFAS